MRWRPSIRLVVPLMMAAPIVAVAATLVILSVSTNQHIAEDLGNRWMESSTQHVQREVRDFLGESVRVSDRYTLSLARGTLSANNLESWREEMLADLATVPEVASICFGTPDGRAVWLLRGPDGLEFAVAANGRAREWRVDPHSSYTSPLRESDYAVTERGWYRLALERREPTWTPIYFWYGQSGAATQIGTGYTRPVRSADGGLLGVLVVDVTLGELSSFLRRSPLAQRGDVFIVDEAGLLVASSDGGVMSAEGGRLRLTDSSSAAARSLAAAIPPYGATWFRDSILREAQLDGRRAWARVDPVRPFRGVEWRLASIIPEAVFLGDAHEAQSRSLWMATAATAGVVVLGLILARHIAMPILRLRRHAQRIGSGEFDARLELHGARELEQLVGDLNRMSASLKDAVEMKQALAVADEVQQSLLPSSPPQRETLDFYGGSRYCDATGGDYFDFIEITESGDPPHRRVLVAVGDVMGHGVAAALLMATARAALRVSASETGSLGRLLTRVNDVLARDARHGRFMTLALAVVEPEGRVLRWASAGHDPPMVYDPERDAFLDIDGGDMPLGVAEGVEYEEYRCTIPPTAVVAIGTDGIWEARGPSSEMFGKERLRQVIRKTADASAADTAAALREAMMQHLGGLAIRDDVTFVLLKMKAKPALAV